MTNTIIPPSGDNYNRLRALADARLIVASKLVGTHPDYAEFAQLGRVWIYLYNQSAEVGR